MLNVQRNCSYTYICVYIYINIYIRIHMYEYIYIYVYMYICIYFLKRGPALELGAVTLYTRIWCSSPLPPRPQVFCCITVSLTACLDDTCLSYHCRASTRFKVLTLEAEHLAVSIENHRLPYLYIHVYIHEYIYIYKHMWVNVYINMNINIYIYIYSYICTHVYLHLI